MQADLLSAPVDESPLHSTSLNARLAKYFMARKGQWIDGRELATVAGAYAWRSRISNLRRDPWAMQIDNRQRRVEGYIVSEYRFVTEA